MLQWPELCTRGATSLTSTAGPLPWPTTNSVCTVPVPGCSHSAKEIAYANREHLQIHAEEITAELKIDSYTSGEKLGPMEREAVKNFAEAYMQEGHGSVIISRPGGGSDDGAAMRAAADARALMLAEGVDAGHIAEGPYDASGARIAPLVISYRTYKDKTELTMFRDIHPMMANRFELWRLADFELERVSGSSHGQSAAPQDIFMLRAKARSNPKDTRLFAFVNVRGPWDLL